MRATVEVKHEDRVAGLLEANNRYLGRARAAEAKAAVLALALDRIADAAGQRPSGLDAIGAVIGAALADGCLIDFGPSEHGSRFRAAVNRAYPGKLPTRAACICPAPSACALCPSEEAVAAADRDLSAWLDARSLPEDEPIQVIAEIAADALTEIAGPAHPALNDLMTLAEVAREALRHATITTRMRLLLDLAVARLFPDEMTTRERCSHCPGRGRTGCHDCPSDQVLAQWIADRAEAA